MDEEVYSMEITFKGKPRILTIRVSDGFMDVMLTDLKGNEIEYLKQEGKNITIEKPK
jgi:hypothetical protein